MITSLFLACAVAIALLLFLSIFFIKPLKGIFFMLLRTAFGWAGLYILNLVLAFSGFSIGVNIASASIVGILGLPGLVLLFLVKRIF